MSFGEKFLKAINKIYSKQNATICINNDMTEPFLVQRGTRQGCPLSSLLFVLILEVLLNNIQKYEKIKGVKIKNCHFKYRAFADDVVFFVQNPEENLPKLIKKIEEFGQMVGFCINKKNQKF